MSRPPAAPLPPLTVEQAALADRRAQCLLAATEVLVARATPGGFVSVRDVGPAARQAGTPEPDWKAERTMVRAAGFGRFATAGVLGDWCSLLGAAHEAGRAVGEPVDAVAVSRCSLAWCLAGRPEHPWLTELLRLAREITIDDVHSETPQRPYYRRTLDGWREVLAAG
jgi:hypothetical protein